MYASLDLITSGTSGTARVGGACPGRFSFVGLTTCYAAARAEQLQVREPLAIRRLRISSSIYGGQASAAQAASAKWTKEIPIMRPNPVMLCARISAHPRFSGDIRSSALCFNLFCYAGKLGANNKSAPVVPQSIHTLDQSVI